MPETKVCDCHASKKACISRDADAVVLRVVVATACSAIVDFGYKTTSATGLVRFRKLLWR